MDPFPTTSTLSALTAARRILHDASRDARALHSRVDGIADTTDWRSRATDDYRAGAAGLVEDVARLVRLIQLCDDDLAAAQRAETSRALVGCS